MGRRRKPKTQPNSKSMTTAIQTDETKKPKVQYSIEGEDKVKRIYRDAAGEKVQVARIDTVSGIVEMAKDYTNFRVALVNYLNSESVKYTEFANIGSELKPAGAPPRPKKNPRLGIKTPAIVEWYAENNRPVFLSKYGVKEVQKRTGFETVTDKVRGEDGKLMEVTNRIPIYAPTGTLDFDLEKVKSGEQRLIADCKTHLTDKLKDTGNDPDSDWSLDD